MLPSVLEEKIFTLVPKPARSGRQTTYDITDLIAISLVCKRWKDTCFARNETAPYIQLFRRQFSSVAHFPYGVVPQVYFRCIDECQGYNSLSFKNAIISDYELCVADMDKKLEGRDKMTSTKPYDGASYFELPPLSRAIYSCADRSTAIFLKSEHLCADFNDSPFYKEQDENFKEALSVSISSMNLNGKNLEILKALHFALICFECTFPHESYEKILQLILSHEYMIIGKAFECLSYKSEILAQVGRECSSHRSKGTQGSKTPSKRSSFHTK
jgi:hypothetical protein